MHIEPFGYFRDEPFGWTDCDKDDEGAMPLFDGAVIMDLQKQLATECTSLFAESQRKQQLGQHVGELVGVLEGLLDDVSGCCCTKYNRSEARAVIQKVRGE